MYWIFDSISLYVDREIEGLLQNWFLCIGEGDRVPFILRRMSGEEEENAAELKIGDGNVLLLLEIETDWRVFTRSIPANNTSILSLNNDED